MNYDLKIYGLMGLNTRHIETIDKVYSSIIDDDFVLEKQPKRIKEIIKQLAHLPLSMRPKFSFESPIFNPARRLKNFAHRKWEKNKLKFKTNTN